MAEINGSLNRHAALAISEIGSAAGALTLLGTSILPPLPPALLSAAVTPSGTAPIVNLAVDLAISRDPDLVAAAFAEVPLVISANCPIVAAPFASDSGQTMSLAQFPADFEKAYPGLKLATGLEHLHFAPVLTKASLRAIGGGGMGQNPSGAVRPLWVVDLSNSGPSYSIDGSAPRFYALEPLSSVPFSANDVEVPIYKSGKGPTGTAKANFRGADPEQWNLAFLEAIDLVLSSLYAAAAVSVPDLADDLKTIVAAKLSIAEGLATLVAALSDDDPKGLKAAKDAATQQLLVSLSNAYRIDSLVQFDVLATGGGAGKVGPAPRLAGKLTSKILMTPPDSVTVDPAHPFAALVQSAELSALYVVETIFELPDLVRPGVTTNLGGKPYTTAAGDRIATIANFYEVEAERLADELSLAPGSKSLFAGSAPERAFASI